jgi:hypothetical protein
VVALCDELRRLGAADGVYLEISFDEFNVYVRAWPAEQTDLL